MTDGQRKLLERLMTGPVTIVGEVQVRLAEILVFRKWATMDGTIKNRVVELTITDDGRRALERSPGIKRRDR